MTSNQLKKLADQYQLDLKYITRWAPPEDADLRPLIAMPNIPKPLHGPGCQPRTILKPSTWEHMRKACYANAGYKCEICGAEVGVDIKKRQLHAHEAYDIDYKTGTSTFVRCIAACARCHLAGIHTGRAITLYKDGNSLYPKDFLLEGAEHAFKIIHEYNSEHPGSDVRAYATFIEYLRFPELREKMLELIKRYGIRFYMEDPKKMAKWKEWRLVVDGKEYPTPYENEGAWRRAMDEASKKDTARQAGSRNNFTGDIYNKIDEIIKNY